MNAGDRLWIISGHDHVDMQLPAMDMDMVQLPMADMLLSATDMTLLNMDMDRPLPECSMVVKLLPTLGYASFMSRI